MSDKPVLYLLDAYALIFRAYYAFIRNPRVNSKGLNTSAMFGFTNTLADILNTAAPTHMAVAFDLSGPVFRNDDFPAYKANRDETPDDIVRSIPYIRQIIEAFNIPILEKEGYEADDLIGTMATQAAREGFEVYMVTPDKDFGQLVTEHIKMFKPGRQGNAHEIWGVKEVCEKFNIASTDQVRDVLGLWGDAVDNIPGIPGIGEKTASKLLAEYHSLENLLDHADELKGKMKENVKAYAEQARLSKKLATIICDVPIAVKPGDLKRRDPNKDALREVFAQLEFRTLSERLLGEKMGASTGAQMELFAAESGEEPPKAAPADMRSYSPTEVRYQLIETKDKRDKFIRELLKQRAVCFDTETTSVDAHQAELVGMSFCWKAGEAYYIPLPENQKGTRFILQEFQAFFQHPDILKIGHNLKYDVTVLHWYDLEVQGPLFDTMLAHYLLQPDLKHGMDALAETYLQYRPISIESLLGKKGKGQKSMREVELDEVVPYACEDADITWQLYQLFEPALQKQEGIAKLFKTVEMPLLPVLARMEARGVTIDSQALQSISEELSSEALQLEEEIYELAGHTFNISSPKQLGVVLFDELQIGGKPKKTKSGQYSTNEDTLQRLADEHEIVGKILDYRQVIKLKSTYVDALPELINPRDQRIHTTYMQAVAATGRLSSQNPNLQNIPIRTARGREVRKAFVPSAPDRVILAADYSQIELRLIAELSGDTAMKQAFQNKEDIHAATAAKVFGVPPAEVSREMRNQAKTVNFGIIYGISAFGLAQRIHVSRSEAAALIDNYFRTYPGIKEYMDKSIAFAREHGYVETVLKRRRYLSDINARNPTVRGFAERNAINAPIQGSAADMIKVAMVRIDRALRKQHFQSQMILQVHDELVFDAQSAEVEALIPLITELMSTALPDLSVPMEVEVDTGRNWLEAH